MVKLEAGLPCKRGAECSAIPLGREPTVGQGALLNELVRTGRDLLRVGSIAKLHFRVSENQSLATYNCPVFGRLRRSPIGNTPRVSTPDTWTSLVEYFR
jgi:hypothetical protein